MSRFRLVAIGVLSVVALVSGFVALALTGASGANTGGAIAATPTDLGTPTDVTQDLVAGAGTDVWVGRLEQKGFSRTYLVVAPSTVDPSTPLILGLHGRNATPGEEATRDELVPYVEAGQAILVYPVGYNQSWNVDDGCCGLGVAEGLDDVQFVGEVVDAVRAHYALTGPNYIVGYSNGGRLAFDIACRDVSRYQAIAIIGAVPTTPSCAQSAVPIPLFAGIVLDDPELPTDEHPQPADRVLAALEFMWTVRDACTGDPTTATAGQVTVRTWTTCTDGTVFETAAWTKGGHIWPQQKDVGHPDGADLVWSFLDGVHQRDLLAAAAATSSASG